MSKKPFTEKEKTQYAHLIDELHSHLEARYQIKGTIQSFFQQCEVSKVIEDLYRANGTGYISFKGEHSNKAEAG